MKVKRKFSYQGIPLRIVLREEKYMNSAEPMLMLRVIAPNGGVIPISIKHKQTLKSIMQDTISTLDGFKSRGADVVSELTKPLT